MKKALVTGITGQDGSYLAELLLDKGYEVHGIVRRASTFNTDRLDHLYKDPLVDDTNFIYTTEIWRMRYSWSNCFINYNLMKFITLGAQSHVRVSFDMPEYTGDVTGLGAVRILEAIREAGLVKKVGTIRHLLLKCTGRCRKFPRLKLLHFGRGLLMPVPRCMPIG
jgi:GDPmannose 4,6-dehydratase